MVVRSEDDFKAHEEVVEVFNNSFVNAVKERLQCFVFAASLLRSSHDVVKDSGRLFSRDLLHGPIVKHHLKVNREPVRYSVNSYFTFCLMVYEPKALVLRAVSAVKL